MNKNLVFISTLIVFLSLSLSSTVAVARILRSEFTSPQPKHQNNLDFQRIENRQARKIGNQKYTGIVKQIDDIARQITVRIEDQTGGNGSGVIVAQEGNTYYLVTAAHVVKKRQKYWVVTPSQERVLITSAQIQIANSDLDLAVVKFKSNQNYRVAEISTDRFRKLDIVFISGFPARDKYKQRYLSPGAVFTDENSEFYAKDLNSFDRGQNLVYTNLSLPGMSGGAVLDRQGRLVGINTSAEDEAIITADGKSTADISFGFSLGIPISTVVELAERGQLPRSKLQISTTPIPTMTKPEGAEIGRVFVTSAKPSKNAPAKDWLDYGNLLWRNLRSSSPEEAIYAFKTAIELLNRNPEALYYQEQLRTAYLGIGRTYFFVYVDKKTDSVADRRAAKKARSQAAVVAFQQAIAVDPGFYQSWRYLGFELQELRRYEEALTAYQQAIAKNKDNFVLYVEQGVVLRELGRYRAAIDSYNLAMQLKPTHPWIYINRGNAFAKLKLYPEAIADFSSAIELELRPITAYYHRGLAYGLQQKFDLSIADLNRTIELDSQRAAPYYSRGMLHVLRKKLSQATSDCNKALELDPELAGGYVCRAYIYKYQQQCALAIANFDRAVELEPRQHRKGEFSCLGS